VNEILLYKDQLYEYLEDYFENQEWTQYHITDINQNIIRLKKDTDRFGTDSFFVLNMDSFDKNHKIIREIERSIYLCYFIAIFWFDREHWLLTYTELFWN
jgi:hypothetical protein